MSFFGGGLGSPQGFGGAGGGGGFGQPAQQQQTGFGGGGFGATGGGFGQPAQQQQSTGFGGPQTIGGFGAPQQAAPSAFGSVGGTSSPFGQSSLQSPGGFGAAAQPIGSSFLGGGGSTFGGLGGAASSFGSTNVGAFGRSNTASVGLNAGANTGGFGSTLGRTSPQTGFGAAPAQSSFGFGNKSPVTGFGLGGQQPAQTSFGAPGGFGGTHSPNPTLGGFGAAAPAPGGFGQSAPLGTTSPFGGGGGGGFGPPKPTTGFGGFGTQAASPAPGGFGQQAMGQQGTNGTSNPPFNPHRVDEKNKDGRPTGKQNIMQVITCMPAYQGKSTEELRLEDYKKPNRGIGGGQQQGAFATAGAFGSASPAPGGFGAPAPAAGGFGQATGFGQQPTPTGFGFGTAPVPAPAAGGFGFGSSAPAPAPGGFGGGFGAPATGFGAAAAPAPGGFGAAPAFGAPAPAPGGFGTAFGSGFGSAAPAPASVGFGGGFGATNTGFGAAAAPAPAPFGSPSIGFGAAAPAPAPGGFGAAATTAFGAGFGKPSVSFGSPAAAAPAFGTGFGVPAAAPAFGAGFGTAAPAPAPAFGFAATSAFGAGFGAAAPAPAANMLSFSSFGNTQLAQPQGGFGAPAQPQPQYAPQGATMSAHPGLDRIDRMTDRVNQHLGIHLTSDQSGDYATGNVALGHTVAAPSYRQPMVRPARRTKISDQSPVASTGNANSTPMSSSAMSVNQHSPASPGNMIESTPGHSPRSVTPDARRHHNSAMSPEAEVSDPFSKKNASLGPLAQLQAANQKTPQASGSFQKTPQSVQSNVSAHTGSEVAEISPAVSPAGPAFSKTDLNLPEGYITSPDISVLENMAQDQLTAVQDFKISRPFYGSVQWAEPVDLSNGADLNEYVQFSTNQKGFTDVAVHELRNVPQGQRLNKKALITLLNMFPKESWPTEKQENFANYLRANNERSGATFCSYSSARGEWKFFVEHFSRWGFDDSDDDEVQVTGTAASKSTPGAVLVKGKSPGGGKGNLGDKENASQMQAHPLNVLGPVEGSDVNLSPSGAGPPMFAATGTAANAVCFALPATPSYSKNAPWGPTAGQITPFFAPTPDASMLPTPNSASPSAFAKYAAHTPFYAPGSGDSGASDSILRSGSSGTGTETKGYSQRFSPFGNAPLSSTPFLAKLQMMEDAAAASDSLDSPGSNYGKLVTMDALASVERSPIRYSPAFPYDGKQRSRLQEHALASAESEKFTTYTAVSPSMQALLRAKKSAGIALATSGMDVEQCVDFTRMHGAASAASTTSVNKKGMRNFGLSMGRSFRVGWSRDGHIVHAGLPCTTPTAPPHASPRSIESLHRYQHALTVEHIRTDEWRKNAIDAHEQYNRVEDIERAVARPLHAVLDACVRRAVPGDVTCVTAPEEDNLNSDVAPLWELPTQAPVDLTHYGRFLTLLGALSSSIGKTPQDEELHVTHPDWMVSRAIALVSATCGQEKHIADAIAACEDGNYDTLTFSGETLGDTLLPLFEKRSGVPTPLWERRREMLSQWMQDVSGAHLNVDISAVQGNIRSSLSRGGDDRLAMDTMEADEALEYAASQIFDLLCVRRLADAVLVAQEAGLWRLATILAQLDGDVAVGAVLRQQLQQWYVSDYDQTIPKALLSVYRLIAGEFVHRSIRYSTSGPDEGARVDVWSDSIFTSHSTPLGWERCVAAIFWYAGNNCALAEMCGLDPGTEEECGKMATALRIYRNTLTVQQHHEMHTSGAMDADGEDGGRLVDEPLIPADQTLRSEVTPNGLFSLLELLLTDGNDAVETEESVQQCINALSSEGYTRDPLDHRASYLVLVLLECLGFVDQTDAHASIVRQHMIHQLTALGQYKWAIMISLQITDDAVRTVTAKDLVQRWAGAIGWQQHDTWDENFLRQQLKMPVSWIHEATAYRAGYYSCADETRSADVGSQAKYLIEAYLSSGKNMQADEDAPVTWAVAPTAETVKRRASLREAALDTVCTKIAPLAMLKLGGAINDRLAELLDLLTPPDADANPVEEGSSTWSDFNDIMQQFFTLKSDVHQLATLTSPKRRVHFQDSKDKEKGLRERADSEISVNDTGSQNGSAMDDDDDLRHRQLEAMRDELMDMAMQLLRRVCSVHADTLSRDDGILFTGGRVQKSLSDDNVSEASGTVAAVEKQVIPHPSISSLLQFTQFEVGSSLCAYLMRLLKNQNDLSQNDPGLNSDEQSAAEGQYIDAQLNVLTSLQHLPFPAVLDTTQLKLLRSTSLLCLRSATRKLNPSDGNDDDDLMQQ